MDCHLIQLTCHKRVTWESNWDQELNQGHSDLTSSLMNLSLVLPKTERSISIREWSLITGRGGLQNGRGGHVKFYPYEKGGRKKF